MKTPCPHCHAEIEIDPATLAALAGKSHFACPACQGSVAVPARPKIPASVHRGLNRNLLILGGAALLVLGGLGFFLASQKSGDTTTVNNTSYQEIQNNYFSQIIVNGTTTKEDLAMIEGIKPFGTLFVGMSKEALSLADALDLAKRTGSTILDYTTDQPNKPAPLSQWITSAFSLQEKAWVSLHSQHQLIDGNANLITTTAEAKHRVLLAWQGPKDLMMNATVEDFEEKNKGEEPLVDIVTHPLNGIFSSPNGNGSGRYALNVHPEGRVSGLYFDGNPVSNASVTGHIQEDKILISHVSNYDPDKGVCYLELQLETDGNYSVTQYGKFNGERWGDFRYIITRQGLGGVQESISAAERGPIDKESRLVLYRCLEIARSGSKSITEHATEIDPERQIFTKTWDDGVRGDLVNYEPGKWKEVIGDKDVFYFTEIHRDKNEIHLLDEPRGVKFILKENECELYGNGLLAQRAKGRWIKSRDDVLSNNTVIPKDAIEFDGHYYKFYPTKKAWGEAQKDCEAKGGSLATAEKPEILNFLCDKVAMDGIWLDGTRKGEQWVWGDGSEINQDFLELPTELLYEDKIYRVVLKHYNPTIYPDVDTSMRSYVCRWLKTDFPNAQINNETPEVEKRISPKAQKYKNNHYVVFSRWSNWYDAKKLCESLGGHLVTIEDQSEFDFVVQLTGGNHVFVGATNLTEENKWTWIDGTPVSEKMINDGNVDLPHKEHFLSLTRQFHDHPPYTGFVTAFVCEWEGDEEIPDAEAPREAVLEALHESPPAKKTLTNKAGVSIEVEILSATDTHVKVRLLKNNQEHDIQLETLNQEAQDLIEAWKLENPNF